MYVRGAHALRALHLVQCPLASLLHKQKTMFSLGSVHDGDSLKRRLQGMAIGALNCPSNMWGVDWWFGAATSKPPTGGRLLHEPKRGSAFCLTPGIQIKLNGLKLGESLK